MLLKRLFLCACAMHFFIHSAWSQVDTTYDLPAALIENRGMYGSVDLDSIQSILNDKSIVSVLQSQPGIFIRSNGPSTLASLSIRGGTPEQSTVFWNGMSLQNNTNGTIDLNLLPTNFFDAVSLNNTQSVGGGSGSIAGAVNLTNYDIADDSISFLSLGFGSFGNFFTNFKGNFRTGRVEHQIRNSYVEAKNDFKYPAVSFPLDGKMDTLKHAESNQFGVLYQLKANFKRAKPLTARIWFQGNERNIPATMLEASSNKSQTDAVLRTQADWSTAFRGGYLTINGAWFHEKLVYRDFDTFNYLSNTAALKLHYIKSLALDKTLGLDVEGRLFNADGDTFYNEIRSELSLAAHYNFQYKGFKFLTGLRIATYSNFSASPLLYQFQLHRKMRNNLTLQMHFNSNYRIPTFNNLYWRPGGNSNLIPERSHQQELRLQRKWRNWSAGLNVYSVLIYNQIQWLPSSKGYFEAQQNTSDNRWNRGVEWTADWHKNRLQASCGGSYTRSTLWGDNEQQIFVPFWLQNVQVGLKLSPNVVVNSSLTYQSNRFLDANNTNYLEDVFLIRMNAAVRLKSWELFVILENLTDQVYQMLPYRPMPPRNLQIGGIWKIGQRKTNN